MHLLRTLLPIAALLVGLSLAACAAAAYDDSETVRWLSHDAATITVEEIEVLPHAIDVADRCR